MEDLRFDTENISVEFAALYRFARWYRCDEEARPRWKRPSLGLDAYAGLRYAHTDLKLDGRAVSTFSLGGVDLALHTIASVSYTFPVSGNWFMGIHAGYRALNERDKEGSGPDRTETDLTVHGPWFGFGFHY